MKKQYKTKRAYLGRNGKYSRTHNEEDRLEGIGSLINQGNSSNTNTATSRATTRNSTDYDL